MCVCVCVCVYSPDVYHWLINIVGGGGSLHVCMCWTGEREREREREMYDNVTKIKGIFCGCHVTSSVVERLFMVRWVVGSIPHGGPIEP